MGVPLLTEYGRMTNTELGEFEAAQYISCLLRRVSDLEGELKRRNISVDDSSRADQNCICKKCGKRYGDHPYGGPITHDRTMFLHRLCDGKLVKL